MHRGTESGIELPPDQQKIRAKCYHPKGTFNPFPKEALAQSISARFEQMARLYPNRLALKTRTQVYNYSELNRAANRVAHALLSVRGECQETVALLFENGASFVVASLGALKAGKIQVPLESVFPRARLSYMLEQSQAAVLVTDNTQIPLAREVGALPLINIEDRSDNLSTANPLLDLLPDSYSAVEYTSGSTGRPKGIVRNHRGTLHAIMHLTNTFHISNEDRLMVPRASLRNHLYALLNGAATYPVDLGREEPLHQADWLIQEEITIYRAAVSAFRGFAAALTGRERFPDLRLILLFGEPVYHTEVGLYRKHFLDHCVLASSLGCSEFGDYAYFFVDKETPVTSGVVPGGYAIEDTEIMLLDDGGRVLDADKMGEIAVRSRFGAVGYWRRPDLTQVAFLPDPAWGDQPIYRTGDLGRIRSDGCIFHSGRKDLMVKIRGHRVEVAEVETALLNLQSVKEAVVVGREDTLGNMRLVAYLVPVGRHVPTVSEIRRFLADKLPDFMVPSVFVTLDTLPLTATGKVDRRSLPSPEGTRPALQSPYVAPRNPLEEKLTQVWSEVLGVDRVGVYDNFFDLGGHSLLATQVMSRVRSMFQVEVPLRRLFEEPTVADFGLVIAKQMLREVELLSEEDAGSLLERESP